MQEFHLCRARGRPRRDSKRRRSDPAIDVGGGVVNPLVGQKRAGRPQACDFISQRTNRLPVQHRLVFHLPFEVLQSLDPVLKSLLPNRVAQG